MYSTRSKKMQPERLCAKLVSYLIENGDTVTENYLKSSKHRMELFFCFLFGSEVSQEIFNAIDSISPPIAHLNLSGSDENLRQLIVHVFRLLQIDYLKKCDVSTQTVLRFPLSESEICSPLSTREGRCIFEKRPPINATIHKIDETVLDIPKSPRDSSHNLSATASPARNHSSSSTLNSFESNISPTEDDKSSSDFFLSRRISSSFAAPSCLPSTGLLQQAPETSPVFFLPTEPDLTSCAVEEQMAVYEQTISLKMPPKRRMHSKAPAKRCVEIVEVHTMEGGHPKFVGFRSLTCKAYNCPRIFTRVDVVRRHVLIHTGERPFTCPDCNHRFARSDHLRTHMRVHTGERPYICYMCDQRFCRSDERLRHQNTHKRKRTSILKDFR